MYAPLSHKAKRIMYLSTFFEEALSAKSILELETRKLKKSIDKIYWVIKNKNKEASASAFNYPAISISIEKEFLHYNVKKMMKIKS